MGHVKEVHIFKGWHFYQVLDHNSLLIQHVFADSVVKFSQWFAVFCPNYSILQVSQWEAAQQFWQLRENSLQ